MSRKEIDPDVLRDLRIKRFWSRVDKRGPDDCWNWKHTRNRSGYGLVKFWSNSDRGRVQSAHRFSYQLVHGPIASGSGVHGTVIAHRCDNRLCCNPAHLFATDQKGNLRDCLDKGRGNKAFGERAGRAKLSEQDVAEIRAAIASGVDRVTLSVQYGVTRQSITDIARQKSWLRAESAKVGPLELQLGERAYNTKPNRGSFKKGGPGNPGAKSEKRTIDYARAQALIDAGHGIREVARQMNTTHTTIRRALGRIAIRH